MNCCTLTEWYVSGQPWLCAFPQHFWNVLMTSAIVEHYFTVLEEKYCLRDFKNCRSSTEIKQQWLLRVFAPHWLISQQKFKTDPGISLCSRPIPSLLWAFINITEDIISFKMILQSGESSKQSFRSFFLNILHLTGCLLGLYSIFIQVYEQCYHCLCMWVGVLSISSWFAALW